MILLQAWKSEIPIFESWSKTSKEVLVKRSLWRTLPVVLEGEEAPSRATAFRSLSVAWAGFKMRLAQVCQTLQPAVTQDNINSVGNMLQHDAQITCEGIQKKLTMESAAVNTILHDYPAVSRQYALSAVRWAKGRPVSVGATLWSRSVMMGCQRICGMSSRVMRNGCTSTRPKQQQSAV